jgi:hypothetical protein
MLKPKVVCDTNIWYNLGDGKIDPKVAKENHLIATFYTFEELNTTYNIIKDSDKVIKTSQAIVNFSSEQILENAILYLVRTMDKLFVDERYTYNLGIRNWNEVRLLAKTQLGTQFPQWVVDMYEENIKNREKEGVDIAKAENLLSDSVRQKAKKEYKADKQKYLDTVAKNIVSLLGLYLKEFTNGRVEFPADYKFEQIELFLNAYVEYFFKLDVGGMRVQPNDAYDLYNLIYVKPGMKYWTLEKRWIRIVEDSQMGHYLFSIQP